MPPERPSSARGRTGAVWVAFALSCVFGFWSGSGVSWSSGDRRPPGPDVPEQSRLRKQAVLDAERALEAKLRGGASGAELAAAWSAAGEAWLFLGLFELRLQRLSSFSFLRMCLLREGCDFRFDDGAEAVVAGRFQTASSAFEEALRLVPVQDCAWTRTRLLSAVTYHHLNRTDVAERVALEARGQCPDSPWAAPLLELVDGVRVDRRRELAPGLPAEDWRQADPADE